MPWRPKRAPGTVHKLTRSGMAAIRGGAMMSLQANGEPPVSRRDTEKGRVVMLSHTYQPVPGTMSGRGHRQLAIACGVAFAVAAGVALAGWQASVRSGGSEISPS